MTFRVEIFDPSKTPAGLRITRDFHRDSHPLSPGPWFTDFRAEDIDLQEDAITVKKKKKCIFYFENLIVTYMNMDVFLRSFAKFSSTISP